VTFAKTMLWAISGSDDNHAIVWIPEGRLERSSERVVDNGDSEEEFD
jgi:hypothetical protein